MTVETGTYRGRGGARSPRLSRLLLCTVLAVAQVLAPLAPPLSAAAPRQRPGLTPVTVQPLGAHGFSLRTGLYTVVFSGGRIVLRRDGAPSGLRLTLLPGDPGLDLLGHVTGRQVLRQASGVRVVLAIQTAWATAAVTLTAYSGQPGLLHWRVALAPRPGGAPGDPSGTDLTYTDPSGARAASPAITLYASSEPAAAALTFLYDRDLDSTLFYMADLTALNPFFQESGATPLRGAFSDPRGGPPSLVGASARGLGYTFAQGSLTNLPPGSGSTVIEDSYLLLGGGRPSTETAVAGRFLDTLGSVYALIERPQLAPADWRSLGARAAGDLRGPDVVASLGGHAYLRAYVSDRRVAPELITQLNVLVGAVAYSRTFGDAGAVGRLRRMLADDVPRFYASEYGSIVNNLPLPHGPSGGSESWYYIGDLINLARLAEAGDATARTLLLRSARGAIALAHHVRYVFPRSIYYAGWKGGDGLQPDVAGGYAYLMEMLYGLTHSPRYLAEAKAGVEHLAGYGWRLAYETHMTALAAAACARLFALTGQRHYLELSLLPLANMFTSTWLWDCGYGSCAKGGYHTFFGLNPLPWSPYIAMMEQEEAWQAVREYALVAGAHTPAAVQTLVAEFCRYSLSTLSYTLPPVLPRGTAGPRPGEYAFVPRNRLDLYIPLEDLREGGQPSGQIGQEIYGAGGAMVLGGLASARLAPDLWLTSPYPLTLTPGPSGLAVRLTGTAAYTVTVRLDGPGAGRVREVRAAGLRVPLSADGGSVQFTARGGGVYTLVGPLGGS